VHVYIRRTPYLWITSNQISLLAPVRSCRINVMLIILQIQKHTDHVDFKNEVNTGNRVADGTGVISGVMRTQVFQFKWPLTIIVSHFISVLLPSNLWFWVSCEQGYTVRFYILMTTSIEIRFFWDVMPIVCQITTSVLEKPAAFSLKVDIFNMEASGLSQMLVFCYQTAQHHISHHFSTRIIVYSRI